MNGAFEVGAVALRAQQRALETQANNIANVNTPGFKRSDIRFAEVIATPPDPVTENERLARQAVAQNGGVRMAPQLMVSDFGELQASTSAMDIAIDGPGFIELLGPDGESLLWRGGRLEIDRDGYLAAQGLSALRASIAVPQDTVSLAIGRDGVVRAALADGDELELGQINLVRPESDAALSAAGDGQFRLAEGARLTDAVPGEDGIGQILQGMVELSNVEMTKAMIDILVLQRAYAASAQVIQSADQIASITNNLSR
jgi:flagellar basal-body rod protein FlgG